MHAAQKIEALFAEALELDPQGRERLFQRVGRDDPETANLLRKYVEVLESNPGFLTRPPEVSLADLRELVGAEANKPSARIGSLAFLSARDRIAGYELVRVIGFGGMGVVYEAIQQQPRRSVALKLLRATDASPSMLRRFEAEAEILARLRHPAIAQVFEAGVESLEGEPIPFLAMELIGNAQTIVDYVENTELHGPQGLDQQARLTLFTEVATAVHHAHEQGVIHRDLKPANILVDDTGRPKVIDFGIARVVDGDDGASDTTQTRGVLGTISYMSPEQLGVDDLAVDRRTDVYALGVVLYELLCRALPYDVDQASLPQAIQAVVHEPPTAPSTRDANVAQDLETVLLKALRKTRVDRYATAEDFANDIRRFLDHQPVSARRPSLAYRLRLLSRRRPGLVASLLITAVLLASGAGVTRWLWMRGERLQRQADSVRLELEEVRAALGSSNKAGQSPFEPFASGIVASVEESLADAGSDEERARVLTWAVDTLQRLEPEGAEDRELVAAIAETYLDLGNAYGAEWTAGPEKVTGAVAANRRAAELYQRLVDQDSTDFNSRRRLADSQLRLAQTLRKLNRFEDAYATAELSVANANRLVEQKPGDVAARSTLISALWARGDANIGMDPSTTGLEDSRLAEGISLQMLEQDPGSIRAKCLLAWSRFRIGAWHNSLGEPEEALAAFAAANDVRLELVDLIPRRPDVASDLLWYTVGEVSLLERLRGPSAAADRLKRFLDGAVVAAKASSTETELAQSYAEGVERLTRLLTEAGRPAEAHQASTALLAHLDELQAGDEPSATLEALRSNVQGWSTTQTP